MHGLLLLMMLPGVAPSPPAAAAGTVFAVPRLDGVEVAQTVAYYPVSGNSPARILAALVRPGAFAGKRAPEHFANVAYTVGWSVQSAGDLRAGCRFESARVTLALRITLPAWRPVGDAALRTQWQGFERAFAVHEAVHRDIALQAARDVRRAIESTPPGPCADVAARAGMRARAVLAAADRANQAHDRRTRHGQREGVRWAIPRGRKD